jgi:hypothetical protein
MAALRAAVRWDTTIEVTWFIEALDRARVVYEVPDADQDARQEHPGPDEHRQTDRVEGGASPVTKTVPTFVAGVRHVSPIRKTR